MADSEVCEIITCRLFSAPREKLLDKDLKGMTAVFDTMVEPLGIKLADDVIYMSWPTDDNVDEKVFYAMVVWAAMMIKGKGQKLLITGTGDAVDVLSACIMREYLGCDAITVLKIMREHKEGCLTKTELIQTVMTYRPT